MAMAPDSPVTRFLAHRRIAFVGLSRDPGDFSRVVFRAWRERGYDVVPVNASGGDVDGVPCARRVQDVVPAVEAAFLMTPPAATDQVVRDCAEAGVRDVWMHRGAGTGAVSAAAVDYCRAAGIGVVAGECALMHLPGTGFVHRAHGFVRRLVRRGRS